ncbi:DUF6236 family protein [Methyloversatilis sp.]|uniref:DUF6236 family protein n=1 Tax=Methyloversatilis sp. TaxID=2569862 RepID=UPI002734208D|nr:DUF6236 family protein [Methyloversatilis sp.]MDP2868149.1 DUF6236 family protein [Methyloversatilis sp.]MDP3457369.1 DUF6236 family protein [Methyloversatilis sp.]MDP3578667.1 DUF6236 family protein [Methyloversatilis sp.]
MADKRGIVISPPFVVLPEGGISCGGSPSSADLRKYLLYWDEIDYPDNNFVSIGVDPDMEFLISAGVAARTRVQFQGAMSSGNGEFFLLAQQAVFERRDNENPGLWSIAQLSDAPYFANSRPVTAIEYQLWNTLPVPQDDVPLSEILEFKARRRDELIALRIYLDELYLSVTSASDLPRAKTSAILKLEVALAEVDRALGESGISKTFSSLRGFIAGEFTNIAGTGLGAAGVAPFIGMSPLIAGAIGAGIAFAIKPVLSPRSRKEAHPLTYVSSVRKEL